MNVHAHSDINPKQFEHGQGDASALCSRQRLYGRGVVRRRIPWPGSKTDRPTSNTPWSRRGRGFLAGRQNSKGRGTRQRRSRGHGWCGRERCRAHRPLVSSSGLRGRYRRWRCRRVRIARDCWSRDRRRPWHCNRTLGRGPRNRGSGQMEGELGVNGGIESLPSLTAQSGKTATDSVMEFWAAAIPVRAAIHRPKAHARAVRPMVRRVVVVPWRWARSKGRTGCLEGRGRGVEPGGTTRVGDGGRAHLERDSVGLVGPHHSSGEGGGDDGV